MLRLVTGLLNLLLALIPLPNEHNLYRGLFVLIVGVYVAFFWKE